MSARAAVILAILVAIAIQAIEGSVSMRDMLRGNARRQHGQSTTSPPRPRTSTSAPRGHETEPRGRPWTVGLPPISLIVLLYRQTHLNRIQCTLMMSNVHVPVHTKLVTLSWNIAMIII